MPGVRSYSSPRSPSMAIPPNYAATIRHGAWLARALARSALTARPLDDVAAMAIVRAPNAGRSSWAPVDGEIRVDVGPPHASLALAILDVAAPRGTIFVLHGIRDTKDAMRGWAAVVANAGYRPVLVDLRGHGRSSGDVLTYGVQEAADLTRVLDALSAREGPLGPVGVMGHSYGASTAIQWAGRDPRVAAVVAVAPFASLREVVPGYLPWELPDALARRIIRRAGELAGFDPDEANAERAAAQTHADILLFHGSADRRVRPWHSERIRAAAPRRAELVLVDGASHDGVAGSPKTQLAQRSIEWFRTRLRERAN
jgi:pimeloyl-ACP methyl ester carboxylesterase